MPWIGDDWFDEPEDDWDYEPPPPKPLKERSKKELRRLAKDQAEALAVAEDALKQLRATAVGLQALVDARHRHAQMMDRIWDQVIDKGWLFADFTVETFNADPVDVSTFGSTIAQTIPGAPPRATLTITMYPSPPYPTKETT